MSMETRIALARQCDDLTRSDGEVHSWQDIDDPNDLVIPEATRKGS